MNELSANMLTNLLFWSGEPTTKKKSENGAKLTEPLRKNDPSFVDYAKIVKKISVV